MDNATSVFNKYGIKKSSMPKLRECVGDVKTAFEKGKGHSASTEILVRMILQLEARVEELESRI